jgi:DNA polymerase-3 subunit delta
MHAIDFLRDPAKVPTRPVYAVYGDDAYLRRETLSTIRRQVLQGEEDELGMVTFAGEQASLADVLDEVRTLPFFSKRKVVTVDSADPFITAHRKDLEAYCEHPSTAGVLILSVKVWSAATRIAKIVENVGLAVECKGPHERILPKWLVQMARSRCKVELESDAAELLVELVGPEVGLLVVELEKLAVYVGTRAKIQRDDVARMVGAGRLEEVWNLIDAATTGRGALALEQFDRLMAAGEAPIRFLYAMYSSLGRVHHAGQLRRAKKRFEEACAEAGIRSMAYEKTQRQHAHLGPARVDQLPRLLLQADLDLKGSSSLTPRAVIERLIVQLARPRQDQGRSS